MLAQGWVGLVAVQKGGVSEDADVIVGTWHAEVRLPYPEILILAVKIEVPLSAAKLRFAPGAGFGRYHDELSGSRAKSNDSNRCCQTFPGRVSDEE